MKKFSEFAPIIVHRDGKLLLDLVGNELVDSLPFVITGSGVEQLLDIPKHASGT